MIEGIFVEGLVYGIMVLGVFITFRVLDFPDLTVDGSFPLGAAIFASMVTAGIPILIAVLAAFIGGILCGAVTAIIHNKLKVPSLLAGILTMTMLYSVNIRVLGNKANLPLLGADTALSKIVEFTHAVFGTEINESWVLLIFLVLLSLFVKILLDLFFHTDLGMTLGALGSNEQMVISQGVNPQMLKIIGVGLSNGIVALSGAFAAQYQGFADVSLGQGIVITGLASVMIGEFFIQSNRIELLTLRVLIGSIVFKGIMYLGRYYGYYIHMTPNDLKLITGLMIILSLTLTKWQSVRKTVRSV